MWPLQKELKTPSKKLKCIDVGTGCGFPGLATAIALPSSSLTLIDSIKRKTSAVKEIASALGIASRINVITERAESLGHDRNYRSKFDLAMARAVGPAPVVAEYLVPFLNQSGEAILFRGHWGKNDQEVLCKALNSLQAQITHIDELQMPGNRGIRTHVRVKALSNCPNKFPRSIGTPSRKPLGNQNEESLSRGTPPIL